MNTFELSCASQFTKNFTEFYNQSAKQAMIDKIKTFALLFRRKTSTQSVFHTIPAVINFPNVLTRAFFYFSLMEVTVFFMQFLLPKPTIFKIKTFKTGHNTMSKIALHPKHIITIMPIAGIVVASFFHLPLWCQQSLVLFTLLWFNIFILFDVLGK